MAADATVERADLGELLVGFEGFLGLGRFEPGVEPGQRQPVEVGESGEGDFAGEVVGQERAADLEWLGGGGLVGDGGRRVIRDPCVVIRGGWVGVGGVGCRHGLGLRLSLAARHEWLVASG